MESAVARLAFLCFLLSGCGLGGRAIDFTSVAQARAGLEHPRDRLPLDEEEMPEREPREVGSVFVGELLAIFPGLFVHGLGHYYAGDYRTATRLFRIGEFGYLLTAVGGGVGVGGYYLDRSSGSNWPPITLYATGGTIALIGVTYVLSAWFYDMIDTPRAVKSGGEPPPRTPFVDSLDLFK